MYIVLITVIAHLIIIIISHFIISLLLLLYLCVLCVCFVRACVRARVTAHWYHWYTQKIDIHNNTEFERIRI